MLTTVSSPGRWLLWLLPLGRQVVQDFPFLAPRVAIRKRCRKGLPQNSTPGRYRLGVIRKRRSRRTPRIEANSSSWFSIGVPTISALQERVLLNPFNALLVSLRFLMRWASSATTTSQFFRSGDHRRTWIAAEIRAQGFGSTDQGYVSVRRPLPSAVGCTEPSDDDGGKFRGPFFDFSRRHWSNRLDGAANRARLQLPDAPGES